MAPLTAGLPARSNQDFDLIIKIVGPAASGLVKDWAPSRGHGCDALVQLGKTSGYARYSVTEEQKKEIETMVHKQEHPIPSVVLGAES